MYYLKTSVALEVCGFPPAHCPTVFHPSTRRLATFCALQPRRFQYTPHQSGGALVCPIATVSPLQAPAQQRRRRHISGSMSDDDSAAEEVASELMVLESVFDEPGDLTIEQSPGPGKPTVVTLQVVPAVDPRVRTVMVMTLPAGYPRTVAPDIAFTGTRGMSEADVTGLKAAVAEEVTDCDGMPCLFQAVEAARQFIDGVNYSDAKHSCGICLDTVEATTAFTPACFHSYHRTCLARWIEELRKRWLAAPRQVEKRAAAAAAIDAANHEATAKDAAVEASTAHIQDLERSLERLVTRVDYLVAHELDREPPTEDGLLGTTLVQLRQMARDVRRSVAAAQRAHSAALQKQAATRERLAAATRRAEAAAAAEDAAKLEVVCPVCRSAMDAGRCEQLRRDWVSEGRPTTLEMAGAGGGEGDAEVDTAFLREYARFRQQRERQLRRQAKALAKGAGLKRRTGTAPAGSGGVAPEPEGSDGGSGSGASPPGGAGTGAGAGAARSARSPAASSVAPPQPPGAAAAAKHQGRQASGKGRKGSSKNKKRRGKARS